MDEVNESMKDIKTFDRGLVWNQDLIEALELQVGEAMGPFCF